jgi:hypothetical protein
VSEFNLGNAGAGTIKVLAGFQKGLRQTKSWQKQGKAIRGLHKKPDAGANH